MSEECQQEELSRFQELIDLARSGSIEARGKLLEACRLFLLYKIRGRIPADVRQKTSDSDVVQETLAHAVEHFDTFRGTTLGEFRAWMIQLLRNHLGDLLRAYQSQKRSLNREAARDTASLLLHVLSRGDEPFVLLARDEDRRAVRAALHDLPADLRLVVGLRVWQGLSFEQVGAYLRCSGEAARKRFSRALDHLRGRLDPAVGHEPSREAGAAP